MELTLQQLKQMVHGIPHAEHWLEALDQLLPDYEINTPRRIAAFIAQCAHAYMYKAVMVDCMCL